MSENNDIANDSNSRGSEHSILQASRLGACSGGNLLIRTGVLRPSVLGPSVLESSLNNNPDTKHDSSSNTLMKDGGTKEQITYGAIGGLAEEIETEKVSDGTDGKIHEDDEEPDDRPDPLNMLRKNGIERANMFAAAKSSIPRVEKSGFIFGQNVHERVVGDNIGNETMRSKMETEAGPSSGELLFSNVIQNAAKSADNDDVTAKKTETKSLTDVAREYEESRAQKRKYEEVETFTGEENETNIVDMNCKLFAFVNSNWEQRGRGSLRLNDPKERDDCSRVVFRTSGNLRLLLNTKVWAGMVAERPSQKSLRLTGIDSTGKIKVFLLMARPFDISQLYKALVDRIDMRKELHPEECRALQDNCEDSKNGAASVAEHPDDAEVDDEPTSQSVPVDSTPQKDDLAEPSPKKLATPES